jgi:endoglucanase Acf2
MNNNKTFDLNIVPSNSTELSFCVFDTSDRNNCDYFFNPLIFMETFSSPSAVIKIGDYRTHMPLDWSILVCDEDMTDAEIVPLTSINGRGFMTLAYNPLNHMVISPKEIEIIDIYSDLKWFAPKLKNGCMLVTPLEHGVNPMCALFVRERNKIPDDLQLGELFNG